MQTFRSFERENKVYKAEKSEKMLADCEWTPRGHLTLIELEAQPGPARADLQAEDTPTPTGSMVPPAP